MPVWEKDELMNLPLNDDVDIPELYDTFGGIPRHIFGGKKVQKEAKSTQEYTVITEFNRVLVELYSLLKEKC